MRILLVGAGGVGSAAASIAARRDFFQLMVVADYSLERAQKAVSGYDDRFLAARLDASNAEDVAALCREHRITHVLNAVDPRFVMPIFDGAYAAGADYLDMAMSLSRPHPTDPYSQTGVMLGEEQFAKAVDWAAKERLALVGIGVEPGLSDIFARYAADHLFAEIDEIGVRDGSNITVDGFDFAPSFSIWTTIEECLNPPIIWERERGWFTTAPFSEPEVFDFPEGIGPVECVNVEHEEVLLIPRWVDAKRVTFKYGLGSEFIEILKTVHKLGLDSTRPIAIGGGKSPVMVSPRDVLAAQLPDPATLGSRMRGKTCAGTWVRGRALDGKVKEVYLYHVVDNEWSMREYGHQAVVWQTAVNPVVALELLSERVWQGIGVLGPEALDPVPFLNKLTEYGSPWGVREQQPFRPTSNQVRQQVAA
ncbi:saccharopine dehydrogenase family protein [Catellatospora tritici]|uniref:saccharopine dehydrogenase family protein n=1 Tax=Catellatospora tritici TaxID=2851566 RepID=UPI001C2DB00C|nr:saccharopine dehydrogenase C-terminal domain-containing protein [Catellatospora tritici]MBV1849500.1 saccharopine dehydrogenase NADP-binding domain-containing protein [Catellatospora tritici]MBV1854072.1 saccharopine dehydrogenase NADP-binding domain-containing protein [Catellatospora tritici]